MTQATLSTLTICPIMLDVLEALPPSVTQKAQLEIGFALAALGAATLRGAGVEFPTVQTNSAISTFARAFADGLAQGPVEDTPEDLG